MNKDQTSGCLKEAKRKAKEVVGNLFGNRDLELKGKVQNTRGKVQASYGDAKADINDAIKNK